MCSFILFVALLRVAFCSCDATVSLSVVVLNVDMALELLDTLERASDTASRNWNTLVIKSSTIEGVDVVLLFCNATVEPSFIFIRIISIRYKQIKSRNIDIAVKGLGSKMHCICNRYDDGDEPESYSDFLSQQEEVNRLFPEVEFTIAMSLDQLDEVITPLDKIIVKQTFDCYCYNDGYSGSDYVPKWFAVHCREGEKMTNRVVIRELISQGFSLDCNHRFLEGFEKSTKGGECQFEPAIGS